MHYASCSRAPEAACPVLQVLLLRVPDFQSPSISRLRVGTEVARGNHLYLPIHATACFHSVSSLSLGICVPG